MYYVRKRKCDRLIHFSRVFFLFFLLRDFTAANGRELDVASDLHFTLKSAPGTIAIIIHAMNYPFTRLLQYAQERQSDLSLRAAPCVIITSVLTTNYFPRRLPFPLYFRLCR